MCGYVRMSVRYAVLSPFPVESLDIKRSVFLRGVEAWTLFYPLFGFDDAVTVQVGTEVAVAANRTFGVDNEQLPDEETQCFFLFGGSGIGCAAIGQKTALVGDPDTPGVEAPDMGTDMV